MAYRLLVEFDGHAQRFALDDGAWLVGASPDCAIRIAHPTVSRRHAMLEIDGDRVLLTDVGSSNGTRVDGRRITSPTPITTEAQVMLGSVEARLEAVGAGDLELGVPLPEDAEAPRGERLKDPARALSTFGPAVLESFSLGCLPDLARRAARGDSRTEVAQAVGAALLRTMPCTAVEITRCGRAGEGVVFCGSRGSAGEAAPYDADAGNHLVLRVVFRSQAFAEVYGPLVETGAALIQAAGLKSTTAEPAPHSTVAPPNRRRPLQSRAR